MNEDLPLIMESASAGPGGLLMEYGLPKSEVLRVCKDMYKKDITKLTLQISDPVAMQLNKNMKATFMDQVGTVGEFELQSCNKWTESLLNYIFFPTSYCLEH